MTGAARRGDASDLGPLQLAWLGDAVWELHQRRRRCFQAARAGALHAATVESVRAGTQAQQLQRLDPWLNDQEREMARRGRNRAGRGPRSIPPATYAQATGFETMIGWLFLVNPCRLAQLLEQLEESVPDPEPSLASNERPS
ncbi:ribonuclease III [Synechococcus sp. RSCCF101]|nr:ribonuclease III domain-containing protein [Synechococcus sp. RSCCF101]QEY33343.1 ribonuclease III [Synechococcus sp. RSCCF101]